jgi:hypothetical protein
MCIAEGAVCTAGYNSTTRTNYGACQSGRCTCGKAGEPCCPFSTLPLGTNCIGWDLACTLLGDGLSGATCVSCGKTDGPCCTGGICTDPGTQCYDLDANTDKARLACKICGGRGQPCCSEGNGCSDPTTTCSGDMNQGTCVACGELGQPCCRGSYCSGANTMCNTSDLCVACEKPSGSSATPCCTGNLCDGGCCISRSRTTLAAPMCVAPGASCDGLDTSKAVCDGATGSCTAGTTSCGGQGQACCSVDYVVPPGTDHMYCAASGTRCLSNRSGDLVCTPCGDKGQPCCHDSTSAGYFGYGAACRTPYKCDYLSVSSTSNGYYCTDSPSADVQTSSRFRNGLRFFQR